MEVMVNDFSFELFLWQVLQFVLLLFFGAMVYWAVKNHRRKKHKI